MSKSNRVVNSIWVGDRLSEMGRLSAESFIQNGHEYNLWVYGPVSDTPKGVTLKDANEILSSRDFDHKNFNDLPGFADYFRYRLLLRHGGWWVDPDVICLKPFDFEDEYVFCQEQSAGDVFDGGFSVNGVPMKVPKDAPVMREAWEICLRTPIETCNTPWGKVGPRLITRLVPEFGLKKFVRSPEVFNPIPWWDWQRFISKVYVPEVSQSYSVHLWNSMWAKDKANPNHPYPGSLYGNLRQRYGTAHKTLLAVITCPQNAGRAALLEATWVPLARQVGWDVKFFDGKTLGVPDDYPSLPLRIKALCQWAHSRGYEKLAKIDDDGYIWLDRFYEPDAEYAGLRIEANDTGSRRANCLAAPKGTYPYDYASGGAYWLGREGMRIVADEPLTKHDWSEDRFVGNALGRKGIPFTELPDYHMVWPESFAYYVERKPAFLTQLNAEQVHACHDNFLSGKAPEPYHAVIHDPFAALRARHK